MLTIKRFQTQFMKAGFPHYVAQSKDIGTAAKFKRFFQIDTVHEAPLYFIFWEILSVCINENYHLIFSTGLDRFNRIEKRNIGQIYLVLAIIKCKQKFGRGFYVGRKNILCIAFLKGNQLQFIWGFRLIILSEFNHYHFIWCRMFSIPMCQVQTVPFELDVCQKNFIV